MECRNCPYIKEEYINRINRYKETVKREGIPNDIYGYMTLEDAESYLLESCFCDKVGGKIVLYGHCPLNKVKVHKTKQNKKKRNKRERDNSYKNYLKHLAHISSHRTAYPVDQNGQYMHDNSWYIWFPNDPPQELKYYKRRYYSGGRRSGSKINKKLSNRTIRRYKGDIPNGFWCHKLYDYWWEMD